MKMPNKAFLEIDDSIIKNNLLLTEKKKEDEEFDNLLQSLDKPEPPSVTFRPLPGACIKCRTENGEKVFLNICHTTDIPPPEDLTEEKFYEVLSEEAPTWCVPMSIGHERSESDKSGAMCLTYDIALNTSFFEKCQAKKAFWTFTILTVISAVGEKHGRPIKGEDYVILKNRKVMGHLHDHRVQKREPKKPPMYKPLIEELPSSSGKTSRSLVQEIGKKAELVADPQYIILRKPKEGEARELIGYFKLPSRHRIKDIRVDICEDRIIVEAPRTNYLVDVFVPYTLDQENVTAVMDQNVNVLRLNVPVV